MAGKWKKGVVPEKLDGCATLRIIEERLLQNWVRLRLFCSANAFSFQVRHLGAFSVRNGVLPGWSGIGARMAPALSQQHGSGGAGFCLAMGLVDADAQSLARKQHRAAIPANARC